MTKEQHNNIIVLMIPDFNEEGNLPPGVHSAEWPEFKQRFGKTLRRQRLLLGLSQALHSLQRAGCLTVYVDGSFVTAKETPGDYDACWDMNTVNPDLLDPVFLTFINGRAAQKAKFQGEFFPAQFPEGNSGQLFLSFFQTDKSSGSPKGIIVLDLQRISL